jgi:hypothetical protein
MDSLNLGRRLGDLWLRLKTWREYPLDLISAGGFNLDSADTSSSPVHLGWGRAPWAPWPLAWGSSSSPCESPNYVPILLTWSRLREELVLPTYSGGNGPQKAIDGEAAWAAVRSFSGEALASRSSPTSSSWPPLASRPVQWLQSATNNSNLVAARVRRVSRFAGNIRAMGCAIYIGFSIEL